MFSGLQIRTRVWVLVHVVFISPAQIMRCVHQSIVFNIQTECEDPEKLIEVSYGLTDRIYGCGGLTEEQRVGRWRRRGSGSGWTSEGLCLKRWTDTDTSWAWRTTPRSGWKPCRRSPACLRAWPSTSWTSSHILDSRSGSCPGCLMTSSRKWV